MPDRTMTRDEMERLGALLFGYGWKARIAEALEINRKTVSRWIADDAMPEWAADRLREMATIAPPPGSSADDDRDDACAEAVEPRLTELVGMAEAAGWHRAEVMVAILALTVSDIRHFAGDDAARQILSEALEAVS